MPFIDIDWLKEHVAAPDDLTYEQLAADLVRVGLEEEEIHRSTLTGPIVVGYVVDAVPEPQKNGKIINWCQVDVGDEYNSTDENGNKVPRGIVCGAPNMAAGEKVVVTLPGAVLPGDFRIEPRKTYGHVSDGMCASERELGLGSEHNGIILLREYGFTEEEYEALKPGQDVLELLKLNEPTLEINITPDRGYAFSYRGVCREYHNSTKAAYVDPVEKWNEKAPDLSSFDNIQASEIAVEIDDANPIHGVQGCDRYYARLVRDINPSSSTPREIRRRLLRAGMRPISIAVDATNYSMLDLGQPLHAYDADKIEPPIVVRRAADGEKLTTLDGNEHVLCSEDLLITDSPEGRRASRILGLAGVMGGLYGEVTAETKNVLIEAAHFDPVTIARSARRHKIPSEASRRFERGVDTRIQPAAAAQVAQFLADYASGVPSQTATDVNNTSEIAPVRFKTGEVARLTSLDTSIGEISGILTDIGCSVGGGGNGEFVVVPPSWRPDLTEQCELVEEVARIVGYDKIPQRVPSIPVNENGLSDFLRRRRSAADTLAEYGMTEVLTYPFVGDEDFKELNIDREKAVAKSVELENPLAGDRPYLRTELLETLIGAVKRNIRRGIENVRVYEIGHVYLGDPEAPAIPALPGGQVPSDKDLAALDAGLPQQPLRIAGVLTGKAIESGWLGQSRDVDWTDGVEAAMRVCERLAAKVRLEQPKPEAVEAQWHPGRFAQIVLETEETTGNGETCERIIGKVGEFHPNVCEGLGIPAHSAAFELDLTVLCNLTRKPIKAKAVSSYPPVKQDFAFTVPENVAASQVEEAIRTAAGNVLETLELFDVFAGQQMEAGFKSLAFSATFRDSHQTLSGAQTEEIRRAIVSQTEALGAHLRS